MDLILGSYVVNRLALLDEDGLGTYEALLGENDQELYSWVTGQVHAPTRYVRVIEDIASHIGAFQGTPPSR